MKVPHWSAAVTVGILEEMCITSRQEKIIMNNTANLSRGAMFDARQTFLTRTANSNFTDAQSQLNVKLVDDYLSKLDWQVSENSNMTYSVQGLNNYISSSICKNYWLNKIYDEEIRNAHKNGDLHIHDLNMISVYCVGWDLKDLLLEGFCGVEGKVKSAPAKHFRVALGQIVNFLYTMQGEAAGAQAFSNFDTLLAPFIRYDNLDFAQVKQAMQEFVFNLNVPTRTGFQTPFTNITMDLEVPSYYKKQAVIIGGKLQNECYEDFQKEMNMLNRAFFEVMCEGDNSGKRFRGSAPDCVRLHARFRTWPSDSSAQCGDARGGGELFGKPAVHSPRS